AAFVVDEDDLCNNNALVAQAAAKFESIQLDDDDQQGPSSMIELKPVVEAKKASSPTTSTMPTNCFVSLYVNGKRCLLTIDANCLVYEPELSHSKQNGTCHSFPATLQQYKERIALAVAVHSQQSRRCKVS